jgi:amino acid adenylation domain-containing protein
MRVSQVTLLQEYLERNASQCPNKTALFCKEQQLTWAQIDEAATRLSNSLRASGIKRGDRVVIYLHNCVETAISLFAVLKADAVFSIVNVETKAEKLLYILNDCRAKGFISAKYLGRVYKKVFPEASHLERAWLVDVEATKIAHISTENFQEALKSGSKELVEPRSINIDLASIIYTSGSTGDPKGVMLTHLNMVSAAESVSTYLRNKPEDIVLNVLPMSFDYGLYQWLKVNVFGGTLVLENSFNYPAAVIRLIEDKKVTGLPVVPTIASLLTQFAESGTTLPGVEFVTNTAAALSVSHIEIIKKVCPNARIYSMYGLTECQRVSYLPPEEIDENPNSVGIPMPNMEAFILDPDTGEELPRGEVGELVVRGPHVMKGYWEKPDKSAKCLKPGKIPGEMWLWTGDLFRMDERGYLSFVSRRDDIIKSRGEKVSPKEVENVIYSLSGVQAVAVVGEPDPIFGEAIRSYIVLDKGVEYTQRQVLSHCAKHMENYMVPKYVTFLDEMQKTPSGKITKKDIKTYAKDHYVSGDEA